MSYFTRHHGSRSILAVGTAAVLVITACSGSDDLSSEPADTASTPTSAPATPSLSANTLLPPVEFDSFVAANPDVPVINVHIPYEGHIDGTDEFIAFDSILDSPDLPTNKTAPIALYCRSGSMSAQATDDLVAAGYTDVIDLQGGMNAWTQDGEELLDDPSAAES